MSIHIEAKKGDIAEVVLLPGDPLRAKHIADSYLSDVICYNNVRNMLGFTGNYKGKRISVQGTGMGMPSASIYINELISFYNAKTLIRVGTAGALQESIHVNDIIIAMSASTDSNINNKFFGGVDFAPTADFDLLTKVYETAKEKAIPIKAGNVLSSDIFYNIDPNWYHIWRDHGVLAVEMESAILYTLAARLGAKALTILTISDSLVTKESSSAKDREHTFSKMVDLALGLV
jgi:purine-nucleoside phosphorylase